MYIYRYKDIYIYRYKDIYIYIIQISIYILCIQSWESKEQRWPRQVVFSVHTYQHVLYQPHVSPVPCKPQPATGLLATHHVRLVPHVFLSVFFFIFLSFCSYLPSFVLPFLVFHFFARLFLFSMIFLCRSYFPS